MSEFALYIHYPYCLSRCRYCGFASSVLDERQAERYRAALSRELTLRASQSPYNASRLRSIYFGGGTPSLMPAEYMKELLEGIRNSFDYPSDIEVTLETNPGVSKLDNLYAFRDAGVNRLSIGAQSFHDDELKFLGRIHSADDIKTTVKQARTAGFDNVSLDLIYGVPGQSVGSFITSVHRALYLDIDHLSTYALSIEKGTEFAKLIEGGKLSKPDPDFAAEQYTELCCVMRDAGFNHYELTNFARPRRQSHHNWTYWRRIHYLGIGTAVHSFDGVRRFWNTRDTTVYIDLINSVKTAVTDEETLLPEEVLEETIYLGLRTIDGLDRVIADKASDPEKIEELLSNDFLILQNGRLHIPEQRWLLLDEIALKLLVKATSP